MLDSFLNMPLAWRVYAGIVWIVALAFIAYASFVLGPDLWREGRAWCDETFGGDA